MPIRRVRAGEDLGHPAVERVREGAGREGFRELVLETGQGPVEARLYEAPGARAAVLTVGGVGGGFDSPARNLYVRLAEALVPEGVSLLRVRFRAPGNLQEAVHDVLAGVRFLAERGVERVGLVGHSFGGAVVVDAGANAREVATVVTLATQSHGADAAPNLAPRPLLLVHGTRDNILPPYCSRAVFDAAQEPKELDIVDGAGHGLDESADEVLERVRAWLLQHLA